MNTKRLAAAALAVFAVLPAAAWAAAPGRSPSLLVFLFIHLRHTLFAAALLGLFPLAREAARKPRGAWGWAAASLAAFFAWVLAFSSPFAADVSWISAPCLTAVLAACAAGGALAFFRPAARAVFPAFSAAAVLAGFFCLASSGNRLPLLLAEILSLLALCFWGVSFAFGRRAEAAPASAPAAAAAPVLTGEAREAIEREAVARERARYIQDMHDGLGAELVSTLAAAKNGSLSQEAMASSLQGCLDQMRLSIDAGGVATEDFCAALANLRYRMEPRLKAAGMTLAWDVLRLPDELALPPEKALCALRVLQEALANAIKYSGADRIAVKAWTSEGTLRLAVADNGRGMDEGAERDRSSGNGLGLAGMKKRVAEAKGALTVGRPEDHSGVEVRLILPL